MMQIHVQINISLTIQLGHFINLFYVVFFFILSDIFSLLSLAFSLPLSPCVCVCVCVCGRHGLRDSDAFLRRPLFHSDLWICFTVQNWLLDFGRLLVIVRIASWLSFISVPYWSCSVIPTACSN